MDSSIQVEVHLLTKLLQRYLASHILEQLAQNIGFGNSESYYVARDLTFYNFTTTHWAIPLHAP